MSRSPTKLSPLEQMYISFTHCSMHCQIPALWLVYKEHSINIWWVNEWMLCWVYRHKVEGSLLKQISNVHCVKSKMLDWVKLMKMDWNVVLYLLWVLFISSSTDILLYLQDHRGRWREKSITPNPKSKFKSLNPLLENQTQEGEIVHVYPVYKWAKLIDRYFIRITEKGDL